MPTKFYLDSRPGKTGEKPIRVSISLGGQRFVTSIGYSIDPAKWDATRMRVKHGATNARKVNFNTINSRIASITAYFDALEASRASGEINVGNLYKSEFGKTGTHTAAAHSLGFFDWFDRFTEERGKANDWTKATYQKFAALRSHLIGFDSRIDFDSLTEQALLRFVDFLRYKLDMRNSTIGKQLDFLKWFLNWATDVNANTNMAYKTFRPKLKKAEKKIVFLDWDELMRVYGYEFPDEGAAVTLHDTAGIPYEKAVRHRDTLEKVRDVFCFCSFTSLRYSDAYNLKRTDIRDGYLTVTSIKTQDLLRIELTDRAKAILAKYADSDIPGGKALPVLSNQRMNDYLKDVCELVGINSLVTQTYYRGQERIEQTRPKFECVGTHTARRTFICNALTLGIPPQIVMKWTGHNDYKAMRPYIDITDTAKAAQMDKFNKI